MGAQYSVNVCQSQVWLNALGCVRKLIQNHKNDANQGGGGGAKKAKEDRLDTKDGDGCDRGEAEKRGLEDEQKVGDQGKGWKCADGKIDRKMEGEL